MSASTSGESGYRFDWVLIREIHFSDSAKAAEAAPVKDVPVDLNIEALISSEGRSCRVSLSVSFQLAAEGNERAPELRTKVEGQFSAVGETSVSMEEFARVQAPAILLPFVREAVATISGKTRVGQILLNPMNLAAALEQHPSESERSAGR